jgi:hypothetical protein
MGWNGMNGMFGDNFSAVPPARGFILSANPAINRWAIFACPSGTKAKPHDRLRSKAALGYSGIMIGHPGSGF